MFTARKAAQMAAYFADRAGGRIKVLKLMKLLYLADRESMKRYGEPISFDRYVSMDYGPVLSQTLNLINGAYGDTLRHEWDRWIRDREDHDVSLTRDFERKDLDHLSDADVEILDVVWQAFGGASRWNLSDLTHEFPEWQNPKGSSIPIEERSILRALGMGEAEAAEMVERIEDQHGIDRALSHV